MAVVVREAGVRFHVLGVYSVAAMRLLFDWLHLAAMWSLLLFCA